MLVGPLDVAGNHPSFLPYLPALADSQIVFLNPLPRFQGLSQQLSSPEVFGKQHKARGRLVQPVRDVDHFLLEPGSHQREHVGFRVLSPLNRKARRLVDDRYVLVVEDQHGVKGALSVGKVHLDVLQIFVPNEQLLEVEALPEEEAVPCLEFMAVSGND